MAGEALFVGWGQVVRGREQLALEVFQETVAYYGKLQEDGKIERFDAYLLEPHGGDLAGFFLMHGERSALDEVRSNPEFQRVIARAGSIVDNLGVVSASGGDALARQMATGTATTNLRRFSLAHRKQSLLLRRADSTTSESYPVAGVDHV